MTPVPEFPEDVRRQLAERTRPAHESLHHHRKIGRLLSPTLTRPQYAELLAAFCGFFDGVEQRRRALRVWPELSLDRPIARMRQDLGLLGQTDAHITTADLPEVRCSLSCLGFLYVLHGSAFGGTLLAKRVHQSLPAAPHGYLSAKVDVGQWRRLTAALNESARTPGGYRTVAAAADQAFVRFGAWVTEYGEVTPGGRV